MKNKLDFHKRLRDRFCMDIDHPPKNKKEKRAYIRRKARRMDKDVIRAELHAMETAREEAIDEMLNEEADEALYCHHYGPCSKCLERGKK